ncbi:M48 family metalloprotease [Sandaracinus amylolyticus]|uniref:M48 family metalloprotease n=1 Tax=Sandaracinus amylolyticus TaxID=927083 RepID=UPI001F23FE3B|nr:M48 family metalloprotease [Sandaracinus amylolyticus]UJR84193.1 Hypothetical protein I5071_62640 [Sandaracinus amylolyticus]
MHEDGGGSRSRGPGEVNRFRELTSFYALAWTNWALTTAFLALLVGNTFAERTEVGPRTAIIEGLPPLPIATTLLVLFAVLAVALARQRAQHRRERERDEAARARTSERLRKKLAEWEAFVAERAGAENARVVVRPSDASVMWTASSGTLGAGKPCIVVTSAFWAGLARDEDKLRAAMAHEAGHVAARDVELFHWLLACEWALAVVGAVVLSLRIALYPLLTSSRPIGSLLFFVLQTALGAFGVLACWSALLKARELQADAFAADVLGTSESMQAFLRDRLAAREREALPWSQRAWRALVQPALAWRATLPALRGEIGGSIELQLGLATTATIVTGWWVATFLARYAALEGYDLWLYAPIVVGVAAAGYLFGWWRAHDASGVRPLGAAIRSCVVFLAPSVVLVPASMGLLQLTTGGSLAAPGSGLGAQLVATIIAGIVVCGLEGFFVAIGVAGHALDALRARPSPTVTSAAATMVACVGLVGAGTFVGLFVEQIVQSEQPLVFAALFATGGATAAPFAAMIGHVAAGVVLRRRRGGRR